MDKGLIMIDKFCKEHGITYGYFQILEHYGYVKVKTNSMGKALEIKICKKFPR